MQNTQQRSSFPFKALIVGAFLYVLVLFKPGPLKSLLADVPDIFLYLLIGLVIFVCVFWETILIGFGHRRTVQAGQGDSEAALDWQAEMKEQLRLRHGYWGSRKRPFLLIHGSPSSVDALCPGLTDAHWIDTADAVLISTAVTPKAGWDRLRGWLKQPADGLVLTRDTTAATPLDAMQPVRALSSALHCALPVYLIVTMTGRDTLPEMAGCFFQGAGARNAQLVSSALAQLSGTLTNVGIANIIRIGNTGFASLSAKIDSQLPQWSAGTAEFAQGLYPRQQLRAVLFTSQQGRAIKNTDTEELWAESVSAPTATAWRKVVQDALKQPAPATRLMLSRLAAWSSLLLFGAWSIGSVFAGAANHKAIADAEKVVTRLQSHQAPVAAALDLDELQKQIATLEDRKTDGAPWLTRFGLNHDKQLLTALWPHYQSVSRRILVDPLRKQLEAELQQRSGMSEQELANGGEEKIQAAYADLKAYLMLAEPKHADAAFLIPHWLASGQLAMPSQSQISPGGWRDLSQRLISFHVNQLAGQRDWAISPNAELVDASRESLMGVIGLQNSTDVLYQSILDVGSHKYSAVSLQTLLGGTSSRGLFSTNVTVPGVFTRAAWDERISKAIDESDKLRKVNYDWVLADGSNNNAEELSGNDLKAQLRQRYFADYARAWGVFLNSVQWQNDATLSGTIDQLTLLADAQLSPMIALFKAISYQAAAGATTRSLSDNLVNKAQQLIQGRNPDPSAMAMRDPDETPLATTFGPLLRLTDSSVGSAGVGMRTGSAVPVQSTEMSLARYLERVTAVRLKLQQIMMSSDPDAMSRTTTQAILQGKTSDIADSRDYATRVSASLGEQWSGIGSALFDRPLEQSWGVVLKPAAASLNETWRSAIVSAWSASFSGRYPFAETGNDVSIPELSRFLRSDSGLITQFVSTQLAGMLERQGDQWVTTHGAGGSMLALDPQFIAALNHLTRIGNHLFAMGDAKVRFELKPIPTSGVTDMRLTSDTQSLHYFNQREEWHPMTWPGESLNGISRLDWQTEQSGLRSELAENGRFGLIRLLAKANVTQIDSAQYELSWQSKEKDSDGENLPLRMLLRSEAGAGPLDVLELRNFVLPTQIFATGGRRNNATSTVADNNAIIASNAKTKADWHATRFLK